jgi:hypothetical protein
MTVFSIRAATIVLFLLAVPALPGCYGPFSGAGAMRIDVEVYKGPLSEEPEVQWASLLGHIGEAKRILLETDNFTRAVIANKGFDGLTKWPPHEWPVPRIKTVNYIDNVKKEKVEDLIAGSNKTLDEMEEIASKVTGPSAKEIEGLKKGLEKLRGKSADDLCQHVNPDNPWYYMMFWRLFGLLDDMDHYDCLILVTLVADTQDAIRHVEDVENKVATPKEGEKKTLDSTEVQSVVQETAHLSAILRDKAFRFAVASTAGQSMSFKVRIAVVNAVVAFSEVGNQLKTRADALAKQLDNKTGLDRRELPPGVALRESEPTDFIQLYKWWDASSPSLLGKYVQGIGWVGDRVKGVEELYSDHYWSKINTVYASGRGKVSMAFIKDDVGNWNLKSYDNDPENLLKAYTNFSITAVEKAMEIVQKVSPAGPASTAADSIGILLRKADETAFKSPTTPTQASEGAILSRLHRKTELELLAHVRQRAGKEQGLLDSYIKAMNDLKSTPKDPALQTKLEAEAKALADERRKEIKEFLKILDDHDRSVDVIASGLEEVNEPLGGLPTSKALFNNLKQPSASAGSK